jgi:hypothetical protein
MLCYKHPKFGSLLPTYFFAEQENVIPDVKCCWLSRCYFDPTRMSSRGYGIVRMNWWRTLFTDLSVPLEVIYDNFDKKSTRYPIRRAEQILQSNPSWQIEPPGEHRTEDDTVIVEFYNRKNIGTITVEVLKRSVTRPNWLSSRVVYCGDVVLVRTYICDRDAGIVRSLYAVTKEVPNEIKHDLGHLSRMLCWVDIQHFKREGYRLYDWGGVSKHGELAGIDSFKKSFGGKPAVIYDALICKKPIAPVLRVLWRLRFGCYPEVERYVASDEKSD